MPRRRTRPTGSPHESPPRSAAGRRRPSDFAVFYRVNALSRAFEFALRELGVPYQMVNGLEFFQRKEIKDILAYLHLLNNPQDDVALLRVINTPPRGIGKTTIDRLADYRRAARAARCWKRPAGRAKSSRSARGSSPSCGSSSTCSIGWRRSLGGPIEETLGLVLSETGYQRQLRESERRGRPAAAGQHRGAADRGPRLRRTQWRIGATRSLSGRDLPGERHRRLGSRTPTA